MRSAIIAHTVYQCMSGKGSPKKAVEDFMPKFQTEVKQQSVQEMQQKLIAAFGNKAFVKKDAS